MHLRLRRIPQAARLAAVDRQRSLRLGIAAETARIRIILQRAAEIARAADRHMAVLHGNDPAGQRRSGVLRRVELLTVRAAGQIDRVGSTAEADCILLRARDALDLHNDRGGNAAQRAVLFRKPGIGKRDCRLVAAERCARDRAVAQEGAARSGKHIGAAPGPPSAHGRQASFRPESQNSDRRRKVSASAAQQAARFRRGDRTGSRPAPPAPAGTSPQRNSPAHPLQGSRRAAAGAPHPRHSSGYPPA